MLMVRRNMHVVEAYVVVCMLLWHVCCCGMYVVVVCMLLWCVCCCGGYVVVVGILLWRGCSGVYACCGVQQ